MEPTAASLAAADGGGRDGSRVGAGVRGVVAAAVLGAALVSCSNDSGAEAAPPQEPQPTATVTETIFVSPDAAESGKEETDKGEEGVSSAESSAKLDYATEEASKIAVDLLEVLKDPNNTTTGATDTTMTNKGPGQYDYVPEFVTGFVDDEEGPLFVVKAVQGYDLNTGEIVPNEYYFKDPDAKEGSGIKWGHADLFVTFKPTEGNSLFDHAGQMSFDAAIKALSDPTKLQLVSLQGTRLISPSDGEDGNGEISSQRFRVEVDENGEVSAQKSGLEKPGEYSGSTMKGVDPGTVLAIATTLINQWEQESATKGQKPLSGLG
ncbi:hypothetical protein CSA80_00170 [Candidatus Saccharibacteria bacterium]|nr:MAG: hypothetical protein CSA80_00170 [Candidatus Saccharibacteria bacterium]